MHKTQNGINARHKIKTFKHMCIVMNRERTRGCEHSILCFIYFGNIYVSLIGLSVTSKIGTCDVPPTARVFIFIESLSHFSFRSV